MLCFSASLSVSAEQVKRDLVDTKREIARRSARADNLTRLIQQQEARASLSASSSSDEGDSRSDIEAELRDVKNEIRARDKRCVAIMRAIREQEHRAGQLI